MTWVESRCGVQRRPRVFFFFVALSSAFLLALLCYNFYRDGLEESINHQGKNQTATRKLLGTVNDAVTDQMGESCSKDDIVLHQGATAPLPNGIPTYTVEILNVCVTGCAVSDIHVSCGWFSSARLINPRIFRRIGFDDCLVNDGGALGPGETISFQYANTYRYPLYVSSVSCY